MQFRGYHRVGEFLGFHEVFRGGSRFEVLGEIFQGPQSGLDDPRGPVRDVILVVVLVRVVYFWLRGLREVHVILYIG